MVEGPSCRAEHECQQEARYNHQMRNAALPRVFHPEFPFSVFALPEIYTRPPLISRSSRILSAGCSQGPWNGPVLSLRRIPKLETDPLSTCASHTSPAPVSLAAEICSVLRFAYPAGKVSEAIRRTMLPNNRRVRWLSASISQ